jgi:hypothetical protein
MGAEAVIGQRTVGDTRPRGLIAPLPEPDWDEPRFQRWVVGTARINGWRVRVMDVRSGGARLRRGHPPDRGWPDLLLVKDRLFWAELKPKGGKLSEDQSKVIDDLKAAGQEVHIWTPEDWEAVVMAL